MRTCFNKLSELEVDDVDFDFGAINYYLPNVKRVVCKEKMIAKRYYFDSNDEYAFDEYQREIGNIINYLVNYYEDTKEELKNNFLIDEYEFYIDETEEDFVNYVKEETYKVYVGQDSHGDSVFENRKLFNYVDGVFYIDKTIIDGEYYYYYYRLLEGDYEIPLVGGTYTMKIRYTEA